MSFQEYLLIRLILALLLWIVSVVTLEHSAKATPVLPISSVRRKTAGGSSEGSLLNVLEENELWRNPLAGRCQQ